MNLNIVIRVSYLLLALLLSIQVITDPDFGWHLRVGQYIVETRSIPRLDLFSFSLPSYPYVYHSWLSEAIMFISYEFFGLAGTTFMFAAVLTTSLYFLYKISQFFSTKINPAFFLLIIPLANSIAGSRVRAFGFLLTTVLYYLFLKYIYKNSRLIWVLPMVFVLWVNLHGSFALGLFTFGLLILSSQLFSKPNLAKVKVLVFIFLLSAIATLVNPYFLEAWKQALSMTSNSYWNLMEINVDWKPLISSGSPGWIFGLLVAGFLFVIFFFENKTDKLQKFLIFTFFILSLFTSRFVLALLVFFVPAVNLWLYEIKKHLSPNITRSIPVKISIIAVVAILPLLAITNILEMTFAYSSNKNYAIFLQDRSPNRHAHAYWPYDSSRLTLDNLKGKNLLCEANWSGFLLLLDPKVKVFYWGAMDNYLVEGQSFVFTYLTLIGAHPGYENILEKYNIDAVFLPPTYPIVSRLKLDPAWQIIQEDDSAIVMVKI